MRAPFGIQAPIIGRSKNPCRERVFAAAAKVQRRLKIPPEDDETGQRNRSTGKSRLNVLTGGPALARFEALKKPSIPNALHARQHRNQERQEANSGEQQFGIKRAVGFFRCGRECRRRRENVNSSGHIKFSNHQGVNALPRRSRAGCDRGSTHPCRIRKHVREVREPNSTTVM
jgi:hypothetical protein